MSTTKKRLLYWSPRILAILFAIFVSLFAFDVFEEGRSFKEAMLALFMHLIPTYIIIIALILAWRWEWIGAVLFLGFIAFFVIVSKNFYVSLIFCIPLVLIALLFLLNWIYREELKKK